MKRNPIRFSTLEERECIRLGRKVEDFVRHHVFVGKDGFFKDPNSRTLCEVTVPIKAMDDQFEPLIGMMHASVRAYVNQTNYQTNDSFDLWLTQHEAARAGSQLFNDALAKDKKENEK